MTKKIINILTQSDENYLMPAVVMIVSLCENNKHFDRINLYYLSLGISKNYLKQLKDLEGSYKNLNLNIIDSKKYQKESENLCLSKWNGKLITWFKLLVLSDLTIDTDRILYINPHSIITGNLDYLVTVKFNKNIMLNIYDYFENFPGFVNIDKRKRDDPYFNCGLMLINYKMWRMNNFGSKIKMSLEDKSSYKIADQDFCNIFFKNKIGALPFEFYVWETLLIHKPEEALKVQRLLDKPNYYSLEEVKRGIISPKIIYLTSVGTGRAWYENSKAPTAPLFAYYLRMSKFTTLPRQITVKSLPYYMSVYLPSTLVLWISFIYSFINVNIIWKYRSMKKNIRSNVVEQKN